MPKTSAPSCGSTPSPMINKQIQKDWGGNRKHYTNAGAALAAKHTKKPVK